MADRLLLVEDDPRIRGALVLGLADEGYEVVEAGSGESALRRLDTGPEVDVVLLDLMLPGMDGFAVCRAVRARGDLPIIVISARGDAVDVIHGLEAGADDYVTKPVGASELAARIRALLRRARPEKPVLAAGDVRIHPDRGVATRDGVDVHLTLTELRLLTELVAAAGSVVTREQLLERVWGYDYFGDTRLLDVHVRRLRRKVEVDPGRPRLVLTVRGVGYRLGS